MDNEQNIKNLDNNQVYIKNIWGLFQTVTVAGDLTVRLAGSPKSIYDQLFIDTTTATKKLYIYSSIGSTTGVWYSVTIT